MTGDQSSVIQLSEVEREIERGGKEREIEGKIAS